MWFVDKEAAMESVPQANPHPVAVLAGGLVAEPLLANRHGGA